MPDSAGEGVARAAAVLVTYRTPVARVEATLRALEGLTRVVVDNTPADDESARIRDVTHSVGALFERMGGNRGIGAAQNAGVRVAREAGADRVILVDDDTDLDAAQVAHLSESLDAAVSIDPQVAGLGPLLVDRRSGESMWFEWRRDRVRFVRTTDAPTFGPRIAAFLIASGSLLRLDAVEAIGPFRDDYFIDHVDREWGLRAGVLGWRLLVDPRIKVDHALGETPDLTDRGAVYRHANALRLYYGTRNSLLLVRDVGLPLRRRVLELGFAVYVAGTQWRTADPAGRAQVLRGLLDALRGRRGAAPETSTPRLRDPAVGRDRREGVV